MNEKALESFLNENRDNILLREPCGTHTWVPLLFNNYRAYKTVPYGTDVYCVCNKRTALIHNNEYILMDGDFRDELERIGFSKDFFEVFGTNVYDYEQDIREKIPFRFSL